MSDRPALTAALAVVVLAVGQLAAVAHAAAARHVTCEVHGEELEAPTLVGAVDHCEQTHFVGVQRNGGEHADCAIARVLRPSTQAPRAVPVIDLTTIVATTACFPPTAIVAFLDLVLIAPKTSPPV